MNDSEGTQPGGDPGGSDAAHGQLRYRSLFERLLAA